MLVETRLRVIKMAISFFIIFPGGVWVVNRLRRVNISDVQATYKVCFYPVLKTGIAGAWRF